MIFGGYLLLSALLIGGIWAALASDPRPGDDDARGGGDYGEAGDGEVTSVTRIEEADAGADAGAED